MADTSSSSSMGLNNTSTAPASSAWLRTSSSPWPVMKTTGSARYVPAMALCSSKPLIVGIRMSCTMQAGSEGAGDAR